MLMLLAGCLLLAEPPVLLPEGADGGVDYGDAVAVGVGVGDLCVAYENGVRCKGTAELPLGHTYVAVDGGLSGYCGITDGGELLCNSDGAGDAPAEAEAVSVGEFTGCAIRDGSLACFGSNSDGLADPPSGGGWLEVFVGTYNACAVAASGSVKCWGSDSFDVTDTPRGDFVSVASAAFSACAVSLDGPITCWGSVDDRPPAGSWARITAGDYHYCALGQDQKVSCWGDDDEQQSSPPGDRFTRIDCGGSGCCGITDEAEVVCWGDVDDAGF
jgi:hypothetical protein